LRMKRAYDEGETLPAGVSLGLWVMDGVHCFLVALAALYAIWLIPVNVIAALIGGLALLVVGMALILAGMIEFRSIRRVSGMTVSELVTTGVYQWSRNPQYLGWFLILTGISLAVQGLPFCSP